MPLKSVVRLSLGCTFLFGLYSCESPNPTSIEPQSPLQEQVKESEQINFQSARNGLTRAQSIYFSISADLLNPSIDLSAFQKLKTEVLPPMLATANSLTVLSASDEKIRLQTDFQNLFSEVSAQVLNGINLNLALYQNGIESPQSLGGTSQVAETLDALSVLFQAVEYAEQYVQQLAAFSSTLKDAGSAQESLRSQQTIIMNGVLRVSEQVEESADTIALYQTFAQNLTRPELLLQFSELARRAYGDENVALNKTELTGTQTNPNLIQMVVREGSDQYRLVRIEEGQLLNELKQDTRDLSASDFLNQSNVVVIQEKTQS